MTLFVFIDKLQYVWFYILAASTHDQEVFSFYPDETYCQGFEEVLSRYRELVPELRLAGIRTMVLLHFCFLT